MVAMARWQYCLQAHSCMCTHLSSASFHTRTPRKKWFEHTSETDSTRIMATPKRMCLPSPKSYAQARPLDGQYDIVLVDGDHGTEGTIGDVLGFQACRARATL